MILRHYSRTLRPFLLIRRYRSIDSSSADAAALHEAFKAQMAELAQEREDLFGFTQEDRAAWSIRHIQTTGPTTMASINQARDLNDAIMPEDDTVFHPDSTCVPCTAAAAASANDWTHQHFTHLSADGNSVSMFDVGHKAITQRTATATSKVIFPPEVMTAFLDVSSQELVGKKGPIFSTAKIAGIMAAKRCSDIIPLCHALPLDKVHIDITLHGNVAKISCECRVTHKTGVEMEALIGASVAALTIYDMCKAVSHRISIEETKLVKKEGGKRNVSNSDDDSTSG